MQILGPAHQKVNFSEASKALAFEQILIVKVSLAFVRPHGSVVESVAVVNLFTSFDVSHSFGNHRTSKVAGGKDIIEQKFEGLN